MEILQWQLHVAEVVFTIGVIIVICAFTSSDTEAAKDRMKHNGERIWK